MFIETLTRRGTVRHHRKARRMGPDPSQYQTPFGALSISESTVNQSSHVIKMKSPSEEHLKLAHEYISRVISERHGLSTQYQDSAEINIKSEYIPRNLPPKDGVRCLGAAPKYVS